MQIEWTNIWLIAAEIAVALIVIGGVFFYLRGRKHRTAGLRASFGPEYGRAVVAHGSKSKAEGKLEDRETRVEGLKIRQLGATERERFIADWQAVQSRFLDHPKGAVTEADELISALLLARGYPPSEFDQRAADISVNHPRLVEYYRTAHGVATRAGRSETTTEDLRNAMIQYRSLFDELVQVETAPVRNVA
jgi:hypothetical protein